MEEQSQCKKTKILLLELVFPLLNANISSANSWLALVITITFLQILNFLILKDAYNNKDDLTSENFCFSMLTSKAIHATYCT